MLWTNHQIKQANLNYSRGEWSWCYPSKEFPFSNHTLCQTTLFGTSDLVLIWGAHIPVPRQLGQQSPSSHTLTDSLFHCSLVMCGFPSLSNSSYTHFECGPKCTSSPRKSGMHGGPNSSVGYAFRWDSKYTSPWAPFHSNWLTTCNWIRTSKCLLSSWHPW